MTRGTVLVALVGVLGASLLVSGPSGKASVKRSVLHRNQRSANFALSLNGASTSVSAADSSSLEIETNNAFTVAFWVLVRRVDNNLLPRFWEKGPHYLSVMGDRTNRRFDTIALEVANDSGTGNVNGGVTEFWGSTRLQTNRWYFVAATFNGNAKSSQARIYLDGRPEKMATIYKWSGRLAGTINAPWYIGRRPADLARVLDGELDEMVVYPKALSRSQIGQIYRGRYPGGLAAHWGFDEGAGLRAADSSGYGNTASMVDATYVSR